MANEHLGTYLNDHLAGAVAALDLMEHLKSTNAGTSVEPILAELHADVMSERQELEALMERLEITESRSRQAAAWLAEKVTRLKLKVEDSSGGALRLLEGLDAIASGIEGKQALWRALEVVAPSLPEVQGPDYGQLVQRSEDQRKRVEALRLEAAKAALIPAS